MAEWDLLSALPDLVFSNLLSFLQALPPVGAVRAAAQALPHVCRKPALQDKYEHQSYGSSTCDDNVMYDEADQYGRRPLECRMGAVLMLRLTCWAMKQAIEAHGKLPPLSFVPLLTGWLQQQVGSSPPALCDLRTAVNHRCNQVASLVLGSVHARLHQLRLPAVLDYVCQENAISDAKRKELSHVFSSSSSTYGDIGRLHMRHFVFRGDYFANVGGQGIESRLTLSLPGYPNELVELVCWAEMAAGYRSGHANIQEVQVELHTTSKLWAERLGLTLVNRATESEPTLATPGLEGPVPLLRCDACENVIGIDTNLLPKMWRSLGFECRALGPRQGSNEPTEWTVEEVTAVLLGSLGCAWKADLCDDRSDDFKVEDISLYTGDYDYLNGMHETFVEAVHSQQSTWAWQCLSEWEAFARLHVEPLIANRSEAEQAVVWELVARTVERFFGQLRLSQIGEALALLPKAYEQPQLSHYHRRDYHYAATAPLQVLEGLRVLGAYYFQADPQIVSGTDGDVTFTTSCARWLLRLPLGPEATEAAMVTSGYLLFRYENNRGDLRHCHWNLTMRVIGQELGSLLRTPAAAATESSADTTTGNASGGLRSDSGLHVLLRSLNLPQLEVEVATETLIRLGRLLGLSAVGASSPQAPPRTKKQRVAPPVNTKDEACLATEELKSSSEGGVLSLPTPSRDTRKRVREEEDDDEEEDHTGKVVAGDDHGSEESKDFALQVASLLGFVGEMITRGAREQFPPVYYDDDDDDESLNDDALLRELKGALLPFSRLHGPLKE